MAVRVQQHERFLGVYWVWLEGERERLATLNLVPGTAVYGERLVEFEGEEFRLWDPYRSKLAAAVLKGLKVLPVQPGHRVLYLGAASGTTASHVSDLVGAGGSVFCVEFAARVFRELVERACSLRVNMVPLFGDARFPESYRMFVGEVDDVYCDVAQPEQARVLADNADMFLKAGGWVLLAIKARSIDVVEAPSRVYERELEVLRGRGFEVEEVFGLEPYDRDHVMVVARYVR